MYHITKLIKIKKIVLKFFISVHKLFIALIFRLTEITLWPFPDQRSCNKVFSLFSRYNVRLKRMTCFM